MDSSVRRWRKSCCLRLEARTFGKIRRTRLAAFDFGDLVECYKQASWLHQHTDWLKASGDPDRRESGDESRRVFMGAKKRLRCAEAIRKWSSRRR